MKRSKPLEEWTDKEVEAARVDLTKKKRALEERQTEGSPVLAKMLLDAEKGLTRLSQEATRRLAMPKDPRAPGMKPRKRACA